MKGRVGSHDLEFEIELLDIQELNRRLFAGDFDVAKCSFHAALLLSDVTVVLPSGSALGFGVGPLLLAASDHQSPFSTEQLTLCPGQHTTATLLFRLFYPDTTRLEQTVFSDIMPRLRAVDADFGVCIHEGRFTWREQGLSLVEDLGTRWEKETECPLPLGGLVARRDLPPETIREVQRVVRESLEYSLAEPDAALTTMRTYAQEFDDDVLMKHVDLYVNDWTLDLGTVGRNSLAELDQRAKQVRLVETKARPVEVFDG